MELFRTPGPIEVELDAFDLEPAAPGSVGGPPAGEIGAKTGPRVAIGRPDVWRLSASATEVAGATSVVDSDYYLCRFAVSVAATTSGPKVQALDFTVNLLPVGEGELSAYDLHPSNEVKEAQRELTIGLSPTLKFEGVEASVGSCEWKVQYPVLEPIVKGAGAQTHTPSWHHRAPGEDGVSGSRWMHLVVRTIGDVAAARATIRVEAQIGTSWIRRFLARPPVDKQSLQVELW